jgi:NAD(P)H-flavin reductase
VPQFKARVSRVADLTHDVRELTFELLGPAEIDFKAGQFVSFEVPNPKTRRLATRPYSIASPPSRRYAVTLVLNLVPGGPGSTYLFGLREGDETMFTGPAGSFYLRADGTKDLLLVATGTGIAPFRSMLLTLRERRFARPVTLFWGLRNQKDLYYQEELAALATASPSFRYVTTLSRPDAGWSGATGRVTRLADEQFASVADLEVYLCGNSGMIADVSAVIGRKGLCPIRKEKWYDDAAEQPDF